VNRIVPALLRVHEAWTTRVPTSEVNRMLQEAIAAHPPPRTAGRIRYATQVSSGPPTFVVFGTGQQPASYRRYLENTLRKTFGFDGVPVRLTFRSRTPRERSKRRG
jgi:GTP-binding protein